MVQVLGNFDQETDNCASGSPPFRALMSRGTRVGRPCTHKMSRWRGQCRGIPGDLWRVGGGATPVPRNDACGGRASQG